MRRVAILGFDRCQPLDLIGPHEVFAGARAAQASRGARDPGYQPVIVGMRAGPLRATSGVALVADTALARLGAVDTLIVAGGEGARAAAKDPRVVAAVAKAAGRARRVASVCTGAFVLAAAGLLDGRRATTHWSQCDALAAAYPKVKVERDPIYVRAGRIWTSAGVTAGIDLSLAIVEHDLGREVANLVARWLVVFVRRAGGQSQFSAQLAAQSAERAPLRDLQAWIVEHPDGDCDVPALAGRVAMSVRHFARVFRAEVGLPPAAYVERVRVETARRLLETTTGSIDDVARGAGFGTPEALRRAFARKVGVSPREVPQPFRRSSPVKIAFLLFDRITALDAVGPYEVLARLPGAEVVFAAPDKGVVRTDNRVLGLAADASIDEIDRADLLVVPGGYGTRALERDARVLDWLRAIDATTTITASVCTGALLLSAAGLLRGRRATTHWAVHERLAEHGAVPTTARVVRDGKYATAAGVSAGIDLALSLALELCGREVASAIQLGIEYDPAPPLDAGSPARAPSAIVEMVRARVRARDAHSP